MGSIVQTQSRKVRKMDKTDIKERLKQAKAREYAAHKDAANAQCEVVKARDEQKDILLEMRKDLRCHPVEVPTVSETLVRVCRAIDAINWLLGNSDGYKKEAHHLNLRQSTVANMKATVASLRIERDELNK